MSNINWNKYAIIFGSSHPELQNQIVSYLGIDETKRTIINFNNSEIHTHIDENIRNKHIILVSTPIKDDTKSVNDYLIELLLLCNSCTLSSVKSITCIIPCFPYARSDKKDVSRACIGARVVCDLFKTQHVGRIVTIDLHAGQIQGFTDFPFDNLYMMPLFSQVIKKLYLSDNTTDYVLVSPDAGSNKRANAYAETLKLPVMKFDKQRDHTQISVIQSVTLITQNVDPTNKTVIIIDDILDTMGTMVGVVEELRNYNIKKAIIVATHGIFSGDAITRINECDLIESVIVANTLPLEKKMEKCNKIIKVNIQALIGNVIKRLITGDTISDMFRNIDIDILGPECIAFDALKNEINFFY